MRVVLGLLAAMAAAPARAEEPPVEPPASSEVKAEAPGLGCHTSVGLAAGAYFRGLDWDQVGSSPWAPTMSPVLGRMCGHDGRRLRAAIGVETAPWFIQVNAQNEIRRQWATSTVEVLYGPATMRVGLHGTFGFTARGGGLVTVWSPQGGSLDGGPALELRLSSYYIGATGFQGMLLYTTSPKRKFWKPREEA
jgi:hypothetical protein